MINENLKKYIEANIFPKYEKYYSHGMIHINNVINNMMMLANTYGECVSDSDRDFDIKLLAKRQIATSIKHFPNYSFDEHFERCHEYICKRINESGKFNLWTNNLKLIKKRDEFQEQYLNKEYAKTVYKNEWDRITKDGTYEKIINYYEDY